ncbi:MAG: Mur ligase family protein [Patescibacteria group bacterium]
MHKKQVDFSKVSHIYCIGIGDELCAAIAECLHHWGKKVSGSEVRGNERTTRLVQEGIPCYISTQQPFLSVNVDMAVVSPRALLHPDVRYAKYWGIPLVSPFECIGYMSTVRRTIAVAGCHGKTTVAAYIGTLLEKAGYDPSVVVKTDVDVWKRNVRKGLGDYFITEADENRRHFLSLTPSCALFLNIEPDHLDYFGEMQNIINAYHAFAQNVKSGGIVIANGDDEYIAAALRNVKKRILWFGRREGVDVRALNVQTLQGRTSFVVHIRKGERDEEYQMELPGEYQLTNALAVIAVAHSFGISFDIARHVLSSYHGAKRHVSIVGMVNDIIVMDDAADFPSTIKTVLKGVKEQYPERPLWCIFQSYGRKRTDLMQDELAQAFTHADHVILRPVKMTDEEGGGVSSSTALIKALNAYHPFVTNGQNDIMVVKILAQIPPHAFLITMGAEPVRSVGEQFLKRQQKQ